MPLGRARRKPGQQAEDNDVYYARKHAPGEALERKARKHEKDRLIQERNTLRMKVEQLRLEVASSSYFANASPIKAASGRSSTPVISERAKENERLKKEQLRDAEETLARYDELLEPRQPYSGITLLGNGAAPNGTGRRWTAGGKGVFHPAPWTSALSDPSIDFILSSSPSNQVSRLHRRYHHHSQRLTHQRTQLLVALLAQALPQPWSRLGHRNLPLQRLQRRF